MRSWALGAVAAGLVALVAWRQRALTGSGALAATGVGAIAVARGGLPAASGLLLFFVTSSALSRLKQAEKARRGALAQAKGGQRDGWQVLANGGVAAAALLPDWPLATGAHLGALATACADTWATELGLLAPGPPRLVTSLRPVAPGSSGGVTPLGVLAALGGACCVGAAWAGTRRGRPARAVLATAIAGLLGSLVDSLLGATLQAAYWCLACGAPTESPVHAPCGQPARLQRGWRWVTNDVTNALATTSGAAIGAACWWRLRPARGLPYTGLAPSPARSSPAHA